MIEPKKNGGNLGPRDTRGVLSSKPMKGAKGAGAASGSSGNGHDPSGPRHAPESGAGSLMARYDAIGQGIFDISKSLLATTHEFYATLSDSNKEANERMSSAFAVVNADLSDLNGKLAKLSGDTDRLQSDVEKLGEKADKSVQDIADLRAIDMANMKAQLSGISATLAALKDKVEAIRSDGESMNAALASLSQKVEDWHKDLIGRIDKLREDGEKRDQKLREDMEKRDQRNREEAERAAKLYRDDSVKTLKIWVLTGLGGVALVLAPIYIAFFF